LLNLLNVHVTKFSLACTEFYTQFAQEVTSWQGACSTSALQLSANTCLQEWRLIRLNSGDRQIAAPLPDVEAEDPAGADPHM